ncbi:MAG: hypothetical protein H7255_15245 [Ramlibacter sp.]|nr:hypothetical protein [Ramlibacter sp.]
MLLSSVEHPVPSTRVAALNLFPVLRANGYDPHVLFSPDQPTEMPAIDLTADEIVAQGFHAVIFQKVHGPHVGRLARELAVRGVRTLYLVCDLVNVEMAEATHATVAVTQFLRSAYPLRLQAKIHVVHDGIERHEVFKQDWGIHHGSAVRPLRAVLVTSSPPDHLPQLIAPPRWLSVRIVGRYPSHAQRRRRFAQARWQLAAQPDLASKFSYLRFLANPRIHRDPWDADGVYRALCEADIGILPIDRVPRRASEDETPPAWMLKSENRLTLKMAAALPVIATPIPSYMPVVRHGKNAYFAEARIDWLASLSALRDPAERRRVGIAARASVKESFSIEEQGRRLVEVLHVLGVMPADDRRTTGVASAHE